MTDTATVNFGFTLVERDSQPWHDKEHNNWRTLDALLARYLTLSSLEGVWQNATAYTVGDRVVDGVLGTIWEALVAHTSSSTGTFLAYRTIHTTHWRAISFQVTAKGQWATGSTYEVNDFVFNSNVFATALAAHTAGATFSADASSWGYLIDARSLVTSLTSLASAASAAVASITLPIPITSGGHGTSTVSAARDALGLGTIATQSAASVAITGGTLTGSTITLSSVVCNAAIIGGGTVSNLSTPIAIADGGTAASTASAAFANLGGASTIKTNSTATVTVGFKATAHDLGTVSTGTVTPDPANGNFQRLVNAGGFTLSTPSATGDYQIVIQDTNNASAGAITAAGFSSTTGIALTTTNGDDFFLVVTKINGFTLLDKVKLQ